MKNSNVLPDTCIWIEYFRKQDSIYGNYLEVLIAEDKVYTCGIIISELLSGANSDRESKLIEYTMEALNIVDISLSTYVNAGKCRKKLLTKGKTIPLTDIILAETCITNDIPLLTFDKHFAEIQKVSSLKIINNIS